MCLLPLRVQFVLLCAHLTTAALVIPSKVTVSLLCHSSSSQEHQAFLSAVQHVNTDTSLLPNTTLLVTGLNFFDNNPIQYARNIVDLNISALFVDSNPDNSHEALSSLLTTPLVTTRRSQEVAANTSSLAFDVSLGLSPRDVSAAMLDVIAWYSWTTMLILYDVRWRDHVSVFVSTIPSIVHYEILDVVLSKAGIMYDASKVKLAFLSNHPSEVIALFCDTQLAQSIMDQVHSSKSHEKHRTHNWLLADPIGSSRLVTGHSQVVIGFAPSITNNSRKQALITALSPSTNDTKHSTFLLYDAVFAFAHALHNVLVDNKWKSSSGGGNLIASHDGATLLSYLKKVTVTGTTGVIQLDDGGNRRNARIDMFNLREDIFVKIGDWSSSRLNVLSSLMKNTHVQRSVPLSQLQRKLKIVVFEDPPFVISQVDEKTGNKQFVGYSVDLIEAIAKIQHFSYEFYLAPDRHYGGRNPDGSFKGLIGEIIDRKTDITIMPLTVNSERLQYIWFSETFMHFSMDLVMRRPRVNDFDITGFMTPYTVPVWCMTLVCWFFITSILTLVNYYSPYGHRLCDDENDGNEFSFFNSLWFCLASMLQQGGDDTPRMLSGRIVTGSFWFCVLVWVSTYTANLAALLTASQTGDVIQNLDDILKNDYHMYIIRNTALYEFFQMSDYRIYRLLWERMSAEKTFVDSSSEGFEKVRTMENTVFMDENPFTDYFINQKPCDLMSVNGLMGSSSYAIGMPKHYPYISNISLAILKIKESGLLDDMRRKWWDDRTSCVTEKRLTSDEILESKRIHIGSMVGVYIVLVLGGIASVVVVFVEIWWKNRRDRINAKVKQGWATIRSTKGLLALQKRNRTLNVMPFQTETGCEVQDISGDSKTHITDEY